MRSTLLVGIPQSLQNHLRGEDAATHLSSIVYVCGGEAYFRMEDSSYPVITLIQNALRQVQDTSLSSELEVFLDALCTRCNINRPILSLVASYPGTEISFAGYRTFQEKYEEFIKNIELMNEEIKSADNHFSAYLLQRTCAEISEQLSSLSISIINFAVHLQSSDIAFPTIIAHGIWLTKELAYFKSEVQSLLIDVNSFCQKYGAALKQPTEEKEHIQRQLSILKQRCTSILVAAQELHDKIGQKNS